MSLRPVDATDDLPLAFNDAVAGNEPLILALPVKDKDLQPVFLS